MPVFPGEEVRERQEQAADESEIRVYDFITDNTSDFKVEQDLPEN